MASLSLYPGVLSLLDLGQGLLLAVAAGQHGAHHQLDLVEDHQGKHHRPMRGR